MSSFTYLDLSGQEKCTLYALTLHYFIQKCWFRAVSRSVLNIQMKFFCILKPRPAMAVRRLFILVCDWHFVLISNSHNLCWKNWPIIQLHRIRLLWNEKRFIYHELDSILYVENHTHSLGVWSSFNYSLAKSLVTVIYKLVVKLRHWSMLKSKCDKNSLSVYSLHINRCTKWPWFCTFRSMWFIVDF